MSEVTVECRPCGGTGRIQRLQGFLRCSEECRTCQGLGVIERKEKPVYRMRDRVVEYGGARREPVKREFFLS